MLHTKPAALSVRSAALTTTVLAISLGLASCQKAATTATPAGSSASDTQAIAEEAFIYGFPMVMNYGVMYSYNIDTKSSQYHAPIGKLDNVSRVFTPKDTGIVTPNSDTPYSFLQVDLRAEPTVICVPAVPKPRYYSVQMVDMYTFNYGYIGTRTTGPDAGCFMIAGPGWKGETPKGIKKVFRNETQFGLTGFRTQLFNPADIDNVKKIQAGYKVEPLSSFLHTAPPPPAPAVDWPVIDKEKSKTGFFNYLNFIMQFTPPVPEEAAMRARFASIGIEPGKPFDLATLPEAQRQAVLAGMKSGEAKIEAAKNTLGDSVNGWQIAHINLARAAIGGDWLKRAAVAAAGIYANDYVEALYPLTRVDATGAKLDGSKGKYTITFPGDAMPPVNAFWSVTMYDGKSQLLVDNPINRYLVNSPMLPKMVKNADGGVTIYVQKDSPGKDKEANWLPAPNDDIYLVMRLYWPKEAATNGTWKPPGVVNAGPK
jgi:hypothetical protein